MVTNWSTSGFQKVAEGWGEALVAHGMFDITLAVSMKLMNIVARFSTDFSVTIVAATQVLS